MKQNSSWMRKGAEPEFEYWFTALLGISARKKCEIRSQGYEPADLYRMKPEEVYAFCVYFDIKPEILLEAQKITDLTAPVIRMEQQDISFVTIQDACYPGKLKKISDPPYCLFYRGNLPKDQVSAAIVGARKCSEYGRMTAEKIACALAENEIPVISGLAMGIDSAGHKGALCGGGLTFGVLGCGPDICYPASSRYLYDRILKNHGSILSEYVPGTKPLPQFFPSRNRIISGLSDLVIVVEAKRRSGSLITADFALEQGKEIYAVPGRCCDALSWGTNHLIYQGAGILYDLEKFLEDCNLKQTKHHPKQTCEQLGLEKEEQLLYSCLDLEPKYLDIIIEETGYSVVQVLDHLNTLRKKGLVSECYKNYFRKNTYES